MKKVLLIAGGGTLGTYVAEELLQLGHTVDIVCLEDKKSVCENLKYYKANASLDFLRDLFEKNHYNGIVNFIHYRNYKDYIPYHELLSKNTEHLIFFVLLPCLCRFTASDYRNGAAVDRCHQG